MFTKEDVVVLLRDILKAENVSWGETSDWVKASCPLAPWLHEGGKDVRPSFGVSVPKDGGDPYYHCFACQSKGHILYLLHTLTWLSGEQNSEALEYIVLRTEDDKIDPDKATKRRRRYVRHIPQRVVSSGVPSVPDEILEKYPLLEDVKTDSAKKVLDWLVEERKILKNVVYRYGLRLYDDGHSLGVIFPIITRSDRVVDLYVRLIDMKRFFRLSPERTGSSVDYKATHLCFGAHLADPNKPLFITEGAIDALRLATLGEQNVVACLGPLSKMKAVHLVGSKFYLAFDADDAGRRMADDAYRLLYSQAVAIYAIDWEVVGVNDPGELEDADQLATAVARAKSLETAKGKLRMEYARQLLEQRLKKKRRFMAVR